MPEVIIVNEVDPKQKIVIHAKEAGFHNVLFFTSQKEINDAKHLMKAIKKTKYMFDKLVKRFKLVDVEKVSQDKTRFIKFCDDLLIYFICREELTGEKIPIVSDKKI